MVRAADHEKGYTDKEDLTEIISLLLLVGSDEVIEAHNNLKGNFQYGGR